MEPILIYTDDTRAQNNNFIITTLVYGYPVNCDDFAKDIRRHIFKHENMLGGRFKAFKGARLNARNWKRLSPSYLYLLDTLIDYIKAGKLNIMIYLESREKYKVNSGELEDQFKTSLQDRNSELGKMFYQVEEKNLNSIYKPLTVIYNYLLHREKLGGKPNQEFYYFPDASGNILKYSDKFTTIKVDSKIFGDIAIIDHHFKIIAFIANCLDKVLSRDLWKRESNQKLIRFKPMPDEDSYIIQTADLISNFTYNLIRYLVGIKSLNSELKAKALINRNYSTEVISEIKRNFKNKKGECVCSNPDLKAYVKMG